MPAACRTTSCSRRPSGSRASDPDYYALRLGNAVLGGGFYSTRLSIDLRKNAGAGLFGRLRLQAGRTRGNYFVQYASDPQNVSKAADRRAGDSRRCRTRRPRATSCAGQGDAAAPDPAGRSEHRGIARAFWGAAIWICRSMSRRAPRSATSSFGPADVQAAFKKWMRPDDLVRVSQGRRRNRERPIASRPFGSRTPVAGIGAHPKRFPRSVPKVERTKSLGITEA